MPQALIVVDGVTGPSLNKPINTLVQLGNSGNGGETTYSWTIADQPPGSTDALSSSSSASPTFTPRKEGTYLLHLTVNGSLDATQIVAVRQFKTGIRIPAAGETSEAGVRGHALSANEILQLVDAMRADPFKLVGVAFGALTKNDVVRMSGISTIKAGLPGQESVPTLVKALATASNVTTEPLFVVLGSVDGSSGSVASGALVLVRSYGVQLGAGVSGSAGASVYVSDTATLSLTPGTFSRRMGALLTASDALIANNTGAGGSGSGPRTVEDVPGTTYTLTLQDLANKTKTLSALAPKGVTVPPDVDVASPIGCDVELIVNGAGQAEVLQGAGVTVDVTAPRTRRSEGQYATMLLRKYAANRWKLSGELEQIKTLQISPASIFNPLKGLGTPSVSVASAALTIAPPSIMTLQGVGAPTITTGTLGSQTITPASILSPKAFGTPSILGGAASAARSLLSTNIPFLTYYDSFIPFLDLMKQAPDWGFGGSGTHTLDSNGYPTSVVAGSGNYAGFQCRIPAAGTYIALYDGVGTLAVDFGGSVTSFVNGRYVLNLVGDTGGENIDRVGIVITASTAGNNVRNLRIVPSAHESDHATVLLNPQFKAIIEPFQTLRFMDFFNINNTPRAAEYPLAGWQDPDLTKVVGDWSTRTTPTYALQGRASYGPCLELAIDMCNINNSDFWFSIPTFATVNWCQNAAALIASRLNSNLKVYFEFSNEVWNDAFFNGSDIMGRALAAGFPNTYDSRFGFQNMMGRYMREQLRALMTPSRVKHVIASQSSFDFRIEVTLDYPATIGLYTDGRLAYQDAEMLAVAPYFGYDRAYDPATPTDSVTTIITKMTTIDQPPVFDDNDRAHTIATARSLQFGNYESGQHLYYDDFGNTAIQTKLDQVNRHTNMYDCMLAYLQGIGPEATGPLCIYTLCGNYSPYGRWGWKEDMDDVVNTLPNRACPKYDAAMKWNIDNATSGGGVLSILPASIVGAAAIGTPSVSGGTVTISPASIVGTHAIGTPTITGGGAGGGISSARTYFTGHSLLEQPMLDDFDAIATSLSKTVETQYQMYPGSTILARNGGSSYDPDLGTLPSPASGWQGWTNGQDRNNDPLNAYTEMVSHPSISAAYDHLVVAEAHTSMVEVRYSDSIKALYQYVQQFRAKNPTGESLFYGTWLWITEAHKASMAPWIAFTRDQSKFWACCVSKINDVHAALGHSQRLKYIPADAALADFLEDAVTGSLAGFTGTSTAIVNTIIHDEHTVYTEGSVHLTAVGSYFMACVLYSAIYGSSPVGASTVSGVTGTQATTMQNAAWNFISAYYTTHGTNGENIISADRLTFAGDFAYTYAAFEGWDIGDAGGYEFFFTQTSADNPLWSNGAPTGGWFTVDP